MNKITVEEFNENDYCYEVDDENLSDEIDDYFEKVNEYVILDDPKDIATFIMIASHIPVYEKKYFKLPIGYLKEHVTEYMYDNWYCEDPETYITDLDSIGRFEEEFNKKQHGWYVVGEQVGYMDLSVQVQEYIEELKK